MATSQNSSFNESDSNFELFILGLDYYYAPVLTVFGCIGNIISIIVFNSTKLRQQSFTVYLSALALWDTVFLCQVFYIWLFSMDWISLSIGVHTLAIFLTYVSCESSAWAVVAFTLERFIAVLYPLHLRLICTVTRARLLVVAMALVSFLTNIPVLTFIKCGSKDCDVDAMDMSYAENFNIYDTVVSFTIPLAGIMILNTFIVVEVRRSNSKLSAMTQEQSTHRVTVMLLMVSSVFVLLNLPAYITRIMAYAVDVNTATMALEHAQRFSMHLFYTNFGINFFLYYVTGRNFRHSLLQIVLGLCWKKDTACSL